MTANVFADDVAQCRQAGMTDHLAKPLGEEKLRRAILSCLDVYKRQAFRPFKNRGSMTLWMFSMLV